MNVFYFIVAIGSLWQDFPLLFPLETNRKSPDRYLFHSYEYSIAALQIFLTFQYFAPFFLIIVGIVRPFPSFFIFVFLSDNSDLAAAALVSGHIFSHWLYEEILYLNDTNPLVNYFWWPVRVRKKSATDCNFKREWLKPLYAIYQKIKSNTKAKEITNAYSWCTKNHSDMFIRNVHWTYWH